MDIHVTNLSKAFGDNVVIRNLNMVFPGGKRTAVMGRSGCGKTTLLRILMGLETYDSGVLSGIPKHISPVFQEERLLENFNVISNIAFAADKSVQKDVILRHLDEVGLRECAYQNASQLSGGMKRRVVIVRAMLAKKELLLLDEPLKGLDEGNKEQTAEYIKRCSDGITTIMVTHDSNEVDIMDASLLRMGTETD